MHSRLYNLALTNDCIFALTPLRVVTHIMIIIHKSNIRNLIKLDLYK